MSDYTSDFASYSSSTNGAPSSTSFLPTSSSATVYPTSLLPASSSSSSTNLLSNDFDQSASQEEFLALPPEGDDEAQLRAINTWTKRVQVCFVAHLVSAMALMKSDFWSVGAHAREEGGQWRGGG
jgi:hypothetical protein